MLDEKQQIRVHIRQLLKSLSDSEKTKDAGKVFSIIENMPEFQQTEKILLYWSLPDELPTHFFVEKWSKEKQIFLPSIKDAEVVIKLFIDTHQMKPGLFNIAEPDNEYEFNDDINLIIVPGMAFDKAKNRLGRGKGYYDRSLSCTKAIKWGVGFDCQLLEKIPTNHFDIKMDKIIVPSTIIE